MGKELEKEKTVIIDDPMTPVPLNQRQHWTAPAFIFGGLEYQCHLVDDRFYINRCIWLKRNHTGCTVHFHMLNMGRKCYQWIYGGQNRSFLFRNCKTRIWRQTGKIYYRASYRCYQYGLVGRSDIGNRQCVLCSFGN